MLGFIDNDNISNNGALYESIKDMIRQTQNDTQVWNDILKATDDTLNLLNCFFQVVSTTLSQTGALVITAHDKPWYINIIDKTDNTTDRKS